MTQECEGEAQVGHNDASKVERRKGAGDGKPGTDTEWTSTATEYQRH